MSRKKREYKRKVLPDPRFGELQVSRFINMMMESGKKNIAERALYSAFDVVEGKIKESALDVFHKAIANVRPLVEVRSRRVGGANYQIPTEVPAERGQSLALRWIVAASRDRSERQIHERVAGELMDAAQNRGGAVKKREDTHKMAEANKAFAHFKW